MRNFLLVLFILVIIEPYDSIDYEEINIYVIDNELPYQIKTYGPSPNENEIEYTDAEINRFIKKATEVINYSPYVFQSLE